jgi:hypothetical protein
MSTTTEQSVSPPSTETKKKKRCIGCSVPSQTRKVWLIPHILGFLCFMLVTYRTYEVSTVNEGINTAYGAISNTECSNCKKTFAGISNLEDTWTFLNDNVIPAIMASDTDYVGANHLENEKNNIDMQMRAKVLPVTFLPMTIEQTRDSMPPICDGYSTKTEDEKKFVKALEGRCDAEADKTYLKSFEFGNVQAYKTETDADNNQQTVVYSLGKCPQFVKLNFTYDPFVEATSKLDPSSTSKVYEVQNLSPRNEPEKSPNIVLGILRNCRWTDIMTRRLFISIPFVVRGTSVFGAIQYTVDYSVSGTISSQYRLAYAKHIETAAEYYAHLSSDNVDDKNAALTSLIARVFMTIYLVLDIVLRNMKNIQEAFFKKIEVKEGENKIVKKLKKIMKALFPGMNEYISLFLLISALILPLFNANVNTKVDGLETLIADVGAGTKTFDHKFSNDFNTFLNDAQGAMSFVKTFVVIIIATWMAKLLIIFNRTEHVNIVPQTLIMSLPKILNLMIVILTMVGAFALMAMVCYGHISTRWTLPHMMLLEVYSMMLGEYGDQYAEMYENDRLIAIILFFYFSVILMMTLMNVFMSVVLDTYAEINSEEYQQRLVEAAEREIPMGELEASPKKKSKCIRPRLPHRRSKFWLVPHILGFLAYLNFVYRTYDLKEVNESMNAAKNYISTSEGSDVRYATSDGIFTKKYKIKAFDKIESQNDLWNFLEGNLVPVIGYKMNTDFTGTNLHATGDLLSRQNLLPFIFFPINIEQYRHPETPVCQDATDAMPEAKKNYLKGLGVDCSVVNKRKFGYVPQKPGYNTTAYCPEIKAMNLTVDPFKGGNPLLNPDKTVLGYRIADLAYYTKDYSDGGPTAVNDVIEKLKQCYWLDLMTTEVQISVPFVAKGTGVFGNLQYSVKFTKSGIPELRLLVNFARKTKTGADDVILLMSQLFVVGYLIVEIVLRNFFRIYKVCCKRGTNEDGGGKESCGKKNLQNYFELFPRHSRVYWNGTYICSFSRFSCLC